MTSLETLNSSSIKEGENLDRADAVSSATEISKLDDRNISREIPVPISYEIIQLFSEGLYQSPQKAIEELVTNGFDAGAQQVRVILPDLDSDQKPTDEALFVVDDGIGLNAEGFEQLWTVARSEKKGATQLNGRKPIGQFGIGKLAAFVLAWRLTHISKIDDEIRVVSMNFRDVTDKHQWDSNADPVTLGLVEASEEDAKRILKDLEDRDPAAWDLLFGPNKKSSWTVAILSDFKNLFEKLAIGRLKWVLRTGLPLVSNFEMYVNAEKLISSSETTKSILEVKIGSEKDAVAEELKLTKKDGGIVIPGIDGVISGIAKLYQDPLTRGKSSSTGRSHGFFIKVRDRIINLDDELFGLSALSHGAWSRFSMVVDIDGLHDHLLSSREGVKDSESIRQLRKYLLNIFNLCRKAWANEESNQLEKLSLSMIKGDIGARELSSPLIDAVEVFTELDGYSAFYLDTPDRLNGEGKERLQEGFFHDAKLQPFFEAEENNAGHSSPAVRYEVASRRLHWNASHPLIAQIRGKSKNNEPVELFAASEVITESMLLAEGIDPNIVNYVLRRRDRLLRLLVGSKPPSPLNIPFELSIATEDKDALERATGHAFEVLGFNYEQRGGTKGGPDGVLTASLGVHATGNAGFKIVYDSKATSQSSVAVGKIDFTALADFANSENAEYGFFIAKRFDGQANQFAAVNRRQDIINELSRGEKKFLLLTVEHLQKLVRFHLRYGLTLTQVRSLFDDCGSATEVTKWIETLQHQSEVEEVPLTHLLKKLEELKEDDQERVNISVARHADEKLKKFSTERLITQLTSITQLIGEKWLTVDQKSRDVEMHSSADQIIQELNRVLRDDHFSLID